MSAFHVLAGTLGQLASAIRPLTIDEFTARDLQSSGSIGAHIRHCLDHVCALERAIVLGEVCYDHRERDTVVEHDPRLAESRLRRARARLMMLGDHLLDRPLVLVAQLASDGTSLRVPTTVGRELAFVISHTIHHAALVAVLLEYAEHEVPSRFGLAPTTPDVVCAR